MNIKKKLITFIFTFIVVLCFIPMVCGQAATTDFKIVSTTNVTVDQAKAWAKSKGATQTFINLADLYFKYSSSHGNVNPAIAYAQAAKEISYGNFPSGLDETYYNPYAVKDASNNDYVKFNSWDEGVQAQLDHLALYAGADGYPKDSTYDPNDSVDLKGTATTLSALSGKWSTSSSYGSDIANLYEDLLNYSGVSDSSNSSQSTNAAPNPGTPEDKPAALDISNVIPVSTSKSTTQIADNTPNITSTIGWKNENGAWYYYKSDNTKAIGWIKPDNNWYYLKDDGKMATGWLHDGGSWYYLDDSGAMVTGWKLVNNQWYFLNSSGAMATGIQFDGSNLYYLTDSGAMSTTSGWLKVNNKWYYVDSSGKLKTGWIKDNNNSYFLQGDGSMITGLHNIADKTYMFNDNGSMATGWVFINNNWYYFNADGSMATGWTTVNDKNYYLYDTGAMATGWINLSGTWYYLHSDGSMAIGWVTSNGSDYYLDTTTGRMLTDTTIDGYKIGTDGKRYGTSSLNTSSSASSNGSGQYYGIDISNYDGYVNFNSVKSSGVQFVYIKATEGTSFVDPYLQINYDGASAAGLKVGFYHFLVGTSAPETQADNFYNSIKDKKNDLIPMLDVESTGFDVMDYTLRFITEFKKISNMNIGIYTYSNFMSNLDGRLSSYPLWEANYNNTPLSNLPTNSIWFSRVGHQYSDTGYVSGISGNVDLDEFTQGVLIK